MPRQKTGKPLGRPPLYSDDERPVTVSLRIPHDLAEQMKRYASLHRQSVTELLLDGLRWRIGEGDPLGLSMAMPPQTAPDENEYDGNTAISSEGLRATDHTAVLEEIRTALASQALQLHALAQAFEQRPVVSTPRTSSGKTTKVPRGQQSTPKPVPEGHSGQTPPEVPGESSHTVLQELGQPMPLVDDRMPCDEAFPAGATAAAPRAAPPAAPQQSANAAAALLQQQTTLLAQMHRWQQDEALVLCHA